MLEIKITKDQVDAFCQFSKDYNPLHTDPAYASKTPYGSPVVHGIATTIKAIGLWAEDKDEIYFTKGKIKFKKPIYLDTNYKLIIHDDIENKCFLTVNNAGVKYLEIKFEYKKSVQKKSVEGLLINSFDGFESEQYFPGEEIYNEFLNKFNLGKNKIFSLHLLFLAWTSYFVGMKCPKEHCIYTDLKFKMSEFLNNEVKILKIDIHDLLGLYQIKGEGGFLEQFEIKAIKRPEFIKHSLHDISQKMKMNIDLSETKTLIFGGTRGLGSVLSRAMGLLKSEVFFVYKSSDVDAQQLVEEANKMNIRLRPLKVNLLLKNEIEEIRSIKFDYIFLNAIPSIVQNTFNELGVDKYIKEVSNFMKIFANSLEISLDHSHAGTKIVNISSDYLNTYPAGFSHYVAAKSAIESTLRVVSNERQDIIFINIRLAKMLTDQTNSRLNTDSLGNPVDFSINIIEKVLNLKENNHNLEVN